MKTYPEQVREFVKVRLEQTPNNTQIARDVKNKFEHIDEIQNKELDVIRKNVSRYRVRLKNKLKQRPQKRLFFDIETGYYILKIRSWQLKNFKKYFDHNDIEREKEIICISYKWQGDDEVHTIDWRIGEKNMLREFVKIMGEADEIIGHNGDRFDLPFIRTRCLYHGILMFPNYRTLDTLKKSRNRFLFASNKLDYLGQFMGIGGKEEHEGFDMWKKIVENNDEEALKKMIIYCERDVILLEDVYFVLSPFIDHNNNFAVLRGGEKWHCPECASSNVKMYRTYTTPMGVVRREMKCNDCRKQYKISNKNYMNMLEHEMRAEI
jgi:DNA polymerase elongation subunit (family B)